jgi:glycosyltransferase involved in cell wall biosynthesis
MKVIYFHRKKVVGAYSIENLFDLVRSKLPAHIVFKVRPLRCLSQGFFKRLFIGIEAALSQEDINHITGDIHFIALFLKKRKTILTIHDLGFLNRPKSWERTILKWFWIILPVMRSARVTVISEATKLELLKWVSNKHHNKIHVIHNAVGEYFAPSEKEFNEKEPIILQLGTKQNKNLKRLVEALAGIKCRLEIVGHISEPIKDELSRYQINYSVSENLTNEEILSKYRMADIVAFVSTLEGFGLPIIEANAIGRVVVTSNVSSMPEIAGNAAHLVDPFDVLSIREGFLKVINDSIYRERLILNGFENRNRFDSTTISSKYAALYELMENSK